MKQLASLGIIATLLLAGAAAQSGSSADVQLKAAMHKELVDGDLNAAIEQYKKLLKRPGLSRADAAKVLLHLGECYEKLGDAEARKVYDRVLREYADQTASAAVARGKLDRLGYGMGSRSTGATARHIASADGLNSANVSPDGRFLSYFDEGIWLLDLVGGQKRRLTPATEQDFLDDTVFSPDSKQLAYDWNKRGRAEIHAINLDGSGDRVIYAAQEYLGLWDWVVGKMLVSHGRPDLGMELLTISTNDGSAHKIKEFDRNLKRKTRSLMLSPDGRWIATGRTTDTGDPTNRGDQDILLISTADGVEAPLVPQAGDVRLAGWTPDGKGIVFASDMEGHGNSGVYSLQ